MRKLFLLFIVLANCNLAFSAKYQLPFPKGKSYLCTQGNNGGFSHSGTDAYAFDFGMPIGADICAARGGTVDFVVTQYYDYNNPSDPNHVNRVVVNHGDGTSALYLHLTRGGSYVTVGQKVSAGQVIARAGSSGYSTGPHLHFQVQSSCGIWWCQSRQISFCDFPTRGGIPINGDWCTAVGCSNPAISPSVGSLSFGSVDTNKTKQLTFNVTGNDLSGNISVSSNSSFYTVSPTSLSKTGGTVTVTFKPTAEQNYSGTITLSSSGVPSQTVSLSGSGRKPRISLTERMNISQTKNNTTSKSWDATKVRNMAYGNGKLYLVYEHNSIKAVKSQSGDFLFDLNKSGINGGVLTLCDIGVFDGKIIACNLGSDETPLKVYVWDTDTSTPRLLLETSNLGGTKRLGDCIGFTGNWNSGKLTFANDDGTTTRIVNYAITNGNISQNPTVVNATRDGKRLACSSSIRIQPDASGYWINGKDNALSRLNTSGVYQYELPQTNKHGNGFSAFEYDGIQYAVTTTFIGPANYVGGAMQLYDATAGWAQASVLANYPSAGLGTSPNSGCTGGCIAHAGSNYVEAWVLSTGQGIAYYTYGTPPTHTYDNNDSSNPTLSVSLESLVFGNVTIGQTKTLSLAVSGENLTGNISVSSNMEQLSLSPNTLGATGGVVAVTFSPSEIKTYNGTITISSAGVSSKTVSVTATATELDNLILTEGWNQSQTKGNANSNGWDASNTNIRNMAYGDNGKLYLVYEGNIIKVVESQTGKFVGDMDGSGITGGWPALSDVHYFDGKVVACNIAGAGAVLKVYVWDGERSKPRVLLQTSSKGGVDRLGDNMGLNGDWMDGVISFAGIAGGQARIVNYKITNGTVASTPTVVNATDGGNALSYTSTVRPIPTSSGYYINGKGGNLSYLNASGARQYQLNQTGGNNLANGATIFSYYGTNYALVSTFLEGNYKKGAMQLYNVGNDWSTASLVDTYPFAGLGTTDNINGSGHAIAATTDSSIELWVLSTNQGVAYYKYGTTPDFGAITLQTSEEMVRNNTENYMIYVADNTLYVKGVDAERLELYSLSGVALFSVENQNQMIIPTSLSTGVYIAVLKTIEGEFKREKIYITN